MTGSELLPSFAGRPVTVPHQGGTVYISVHDAEYHRQRVVWKVKLAAAHPDGGGTDAKFRATRAAHERWLAEEREWYARYGLEPPPIPKRTEQPWVKPKMSERVNDALREPRTASQIAARCGIRKSYALQVIYRLRKKGAPIVSLKCGLESYYVLSEPVA